MPKKRAAAYVAALASILALLAESFEERDVSSIGMAVIAGSFVAVLFLTEKE
jgi:hypothetical protein